jgi:hypothetical protein
MKDLGHLTYFLGLEVHSRDHGLFLNQHKYIKDLIELAGLKDATAVETFQNFSCIIFSSI